MHVQVAGNSEVLSVTSTNGMLNDLNSCNTSFAIIERSLNEYLESKKLLFPRFFFLSNDELIEVCNAGMRMRVPCLRTLLCRCAAVLALVILIE